ncbi:MAG: PAS domain S-box protein [Candidatus Neomarinimicrobiota bacterium]
MRASENQFRSIIATASDAIISANAKGLIILWNKGAQTIFGYTEAEIKGKPLESIIPKKYRDAHKKGVKRVLSGGERHAIGQVVELEGQRKNGEIFPLELSLSTWEGKDGQNFSGIIRDITERKQTEEALKKANERMKSELVIKQI